MICIEKEQVTETRWRVDLQADTDEKDPVNGADVDDLRDDIEFYAGSTLTILSPYTYKILGEDGVWHIKDTSGGGGGGGGGTDNYNALSNKPKINGVTLSGDKSASDFGLATKDDISSKAFVATYNVTTAQEIIAYIDSANEPQAPIIIKRGNDYYTTTTVAKQSDNKVIIRSFATLSGSYYMFTYTITNGTWASSSYGFAALDDVNNITTDVNDLKVTVSGFEVVDEIKSGEMRPVTSNAVHVGVGNIETILHTL